MRLALVSFAMAAVGAAPPADCPAPIRFEPKRSIPVAAGTSYFIRAAPGTREVTFATGDRTPSQMIDVERPERVTLLNGRFDPVLSPDGELLTILESAYVNHRTGAYEFDRGNAIVKPDFVQRLDGKLYLPNADRVAEIGAAEAKRLGKTVQLPSSLTLYVRGKDRAPQPAYFDGTHSGSYQSVGVLAKSEDSTQYRVVLSGGDGLRLRDHRHDRASGTVAPIGESRPACVGLDVSLPVVSPNGRELSYYDYKSESTRVLAIGEGGRCHDVDSIPGLVGKTSFSPDGRRLAFHVNRGPTDNVEPLNASVQDKFGVWTFDRDTGRLEQITKPTGANDYYPTFLSNTELAFIHATADDKTSIDVIALTPRRGGVACRDCDGTDQRRFAAAALGAMWNAHCQGPPLRMSNAIFGLDGLTPPTCRTFVKNLTPADIEDEPTLARLPLAPTAPTAAPGRFAKLVGSLRGLFTKEVLREKREPLKFGQRSAPQVLTVGDLNDICDRLVIETGGPAAGAAR